MSGVIAGIAFDRERMRAAADGGHARAVILADRLVTRGVPFREAHRRVGTAGGDRGGGIGVDLAALPADELGGGASGARRRPMPSLEESVAAADVHGGTAPQRVRAALDATRERLGRRVTT